MRHFKSFWGASLLGMLMFTPIVAGQVQDSSTMAVPGDYREWVFLTASLDLNYNTAAAPSHHMLDNIFVNPEAYKVFLQSGTWPDKTVLIKENRMAESAGTLSKAGQFQADVMNLEIHIKDEARFPGKWAFFVSPDGKAPGALMPQSANCYSCHQDHAASDTTFVQFYPTLFGIAKAKGTLSAAYLKESAAK
ncbi:MAG: cytochrome P460 family protein [Rhizomicrobium sp.]